MRCITGGKIITPDGVLENKALLFDSKIIDIIDQDKIDPNIEKFNAKGGYVCPGLISLHIHGCVDCDTEDASENALIKISNHLYSTGVTAWCPTLCTVENERFEKVANILRNIKQNQNTAEIIGMYLEGIFLSQKKKGAHKEEWLLPPDSQMVIPFKDVVKTVICAPELEGATEFIKQVTDSGIRVACGHSNATSKQAFEAFDAGATCATHLFNAMSPLSHREIGLTGAALKDDRVYCELICDNFHVDSALYDIVYKLKGRKMIIITDSIRPAGCNDGEFIQGGLHVTKKGKECRLDDGTIAGSVIDLNTAVNNVHKNSSIPLNEIINAASLNPAKMLGIDSKKGSLTPGKDADIFISDENFNVIKVLKNGK